MKIKFYLSSLALVFFALLGGGSFSGGDVVFFFTIILVVAGVIMVVARISAIVQSNNQKKRLQMIKEDEQNSTDFDRSVFIGDDRCKLYFDASKKQVMIMRVMTEGIKKVYIDDFEFPGKSLASYTSPVFNVYDPTFNVYDPTRRKLLTGTYNDLKIIHQVISITDKDKNKDVVVNSTIQPTFKTLRTTLKTNQTSATASVTNRLFTVLIDEKYTEKAMNAVHDKFSLAD